MWNRILSSLVVAAAALPVGAQTIKPVEAPVSTYIELLKDNGYDAYSFDISALRDTTYNLEFKVLEYEGDKIVGDDDGYSYILQNRTMVSAFLPENRANIKPEEMADADKGIYSLGERIDIGLFPATDSIRRISIMVPSQGTISKQIKLGEQHSPDGKQSATTYIGRTFKTQEIKEGEFTPLVLVGSFWWDPKYNIFRFCGEVEIEPDLSSKIVRNIPHYYVIGVVATKQQDK